MPSTHLSAEELAAYLDGLATATDRVRIQSHLIHCDRCLNEVVALMKILWERTPPGGT
ncbi:MAG: zf-HC2 domain-containing protein [Gemmatimonadales bacterium]